MKKIITEKEGAFFKAFLEADPSISGQGITRATALLDLVEKHPETFGVVISHK